MTDPRSPDDPSPTTLPEVLARAIGSWAATARLIAVLVACAALLVVCADLVGPVPVVISTR